MLAVVLWGGVIHRVMLNRSHVMESISCQLWTDALSGATGMSTWVFYFFWIGDHLCSIVQYNSILQHFSMMFM